MFLLGVWLVGECGSILEVVVVTESGGVGIFEGSRLCCRFLLFYNPQTPFEGGFGRCAPMFLCSAFGFVCRWSLDVTLSPPTRQRHTRPDEVIPDSIGDLWDNKNQTYGGGCSFWVSGWRESVVLPWRRWWELRVVVFGFPKGRGFVAASFFSTTPKPPFKGALVAALLCARCKNQSWRFAFHSLVTYIYP